ncbi:MAG TPA: TonB-dependent receptor [Bacteroidia bacterium]|nr:TonB-dependent receptor [Bacteroidia bacterium]
MKILALNVLCLLSCISFLHAQSATVCGTVKDSTGKPLADVQAGYIGSSKLSMTDANGNFCFNVPAAKEVTIVLRAVGYTGISKKISVSAGDTLKLNFTMKSNYVGNVINVFGDKDDFGRPLPPHIADHLPAPNGPDISNVLKYTAGAFSPNELSTQYSVRGGNFDENLVYVNDIEVYRPFLTRAGQQEGLSFVNIDMTDNVYFSAGGFDAKYGDKMSSVLDVTYRTPTKFRGTASAGLLGFTAEVEGSSTNHRFSWMLGVRNKTNRYVLRSLDTKGDYFTNFIDGQVYLSYAITDEWSLNYLGNYAYNKYNLIPSTRETDFGTINNALRFTVYFDGQEINTFTTNFHALSLDYSDHHHWRSKFILSSFNSYETETFDVQGQYYIDQLEADFGKPTFGQVAFNRGVGTFINHARNYLDAWVNNAEVKAWRYSYSDKYTWNFGLRAQNERINDQLSEWNYIDSAGYSIPYYPYETIDLQNVVKSTAQLNSMRYSGFVQLKYSTRLRDTSDFSVTAGVRAQYWDLNGQLIVSPRIRLSWKPNWKKDIAFKFATGLYDQPPFYRELRDFTGHVNRDVKAQTSVHFIAGSDWTFQWWGRPFRFITEAYYKYLDNLIPYEVDDVRIRYYGANLSYGYTYGLDLRLNGEFVEGVESWVNISLLRTRENLYNDYYYIYLNSDGDTIIPGYTYNNIPTDSIKQIPGFIPRPTDQLLMFSLMFQDHLPKVPSCKMNLGLIFGSGLPFGPPTHEKYKQVFRMPPYRRVDIGFSYELIKANKPLPVTNPFHVLKSCWAGLEVYNLLQVQNTISYYWVKDVTGRSYAIPNYLTNRQLSVRTIITF